MKTLNKITLIAALIASVSAANATSQTATMTIHAYNDAVCSVAFDVNSITFKLNKDTNTQKYYLGPLAAGTSNIGGLTANTIDGGGVVNSGVAPTYGAGTGASKQMIGNLIYSCTTGANANIYLSSANGFKLVNQDSAGSYIAYSLFLNTMAIGVTGQGDDTTGWMFANNVSAGTSDITAPNLTGLAVIKTVDGAPSGDLTGSLVKSPISLAAAEAQQNANMPGHYMDTVTATIIY